MIGLNITIYTFLTLECNPKLNIFRNKNIVEAIIKYFLLSTISTLLLLGGICMSFAL
jgi:NADH:ubiquinone oxidoreductase subunit 2 (subunit N)